MIQDIAPHRLDNQYKRKETTGKSTVIYFEKNKVLLKKEDGVICFPTISECIVDNPNIQKACTYLFSIDENEFYLAGQLEYRNMNGYEMESIQIFRQAAPKELAFAGVTALHLYRWYAGVQFCGRCGRKLCHDEKERMMYCEACGQMEFPKIAPAVIIAITDGNRILLSKYADRDYKKYALIAGYTEIGETLEETVHREVMEEVGIRVKNIRYYKSQPWGLTGTVLMGFYAELDGDDKITLDQEELAMAEWFEREDVTVEANHTSLTNEMIMAWKNM